ncbi:MAG: hypothetical protein WDM96_08030 [Lacunisphaera sp.]
MSTSLLTHNLGFPRIGEKRELKKAVEAYWQGRTNLETLKQTGRDLRLRHWQVQKAAGIDLIPVNDFSFYDHVLDTSCLVGNVPPRFAWDGEIIDLDLRFLMARGQRGADIPACCPAHQGAAFASEMTKWFDTNYHYIVPEFRADTEFSLSATKPFHELAEAQASGIRTAKPVLLGPVTYLTLGKVQDARRPDFDRFDLLERLLPVYGQVLQKLQGLGAEWVQLDEPVFALDLTPRQRTALATAYATLAAATPGLKLIVATYFGGLRDNLRDFLRLPVDTLHVDLVRAPRELDTILREIDGKKTPVARPGRRSQHLAHGLRGRPAAASKGRRPPRPRPADACPLVLAAAFAGDLAPRNQSRAGGEGLARLRGRENRRGDRAPRSRHRAGRSLRPGCQCRGDRRTPFQSAHSPAGGEGARPSHHRRRPEPPGRLPDAPGPAKGPVQTAGVSHHHHRLLPPDRRGARRASPMRKEHAQRGRLRRLPQKGDGRLHPFPGGGRP